MKHHMILALIIVAAVTAPAKADIQDDIAATAQTLEAMYAAVKSLDGPYADVEANIATHTITCNNSQLPKNKVDDGRDLLEQASAQLDKADAKHDEGVKCLDAALALLVSAQVKANNDDASGAIMDLMMAQLNMGGADWFLGEYEDAIGGAEFFVDAFETYWALVNK